MKKHISYSELKNWTECPHKHKLVYIDKIDGFVGNEHTAFGNAVHDVCEELLLSGAFKTDGFFKHKFMHYLEELKQVGFTMNKDLVKSMWKQGPVLPPLLLPAVESYFGDYEVVATELKLYENTNPDSELDPEDHMYFKGFIDAVIKTKDGKYHIIDWKTCSWGWDMRKKADRIVTYQLTLYKYFFAMKENIDPKNVETHFGLLKRTAKKNKIELFKVTSGSKKMENALKLLSQAVYNIKNKIHIKNRLSCHKPWGTCEFYKTKHCR